MNSIELFVGAGGLALGTASAGFNHVAVFDWDKYACDTIRENAARGLEPVVAWPLHQEDVRHISFEGFEDRLDLVAAGPPCQPFSIGGKHRGRFDNRNMFPETIRAIREARPRAFIVENVRGLVRQAFHNYFQYVCLQLEFPELEIRGGEDWQGHMARLERHKLNGRTKGLSYNVVSEVLNAADYGVPQRRERVFIVGFRRDLSVSWSFPQATHSRRALLHAQWVTGEYWDRHRMKPRWRNILRPSPEQRARLEQRVIQGTDQEPWLTTRDAIGDLPKPELRGDLRVKNHRLQPGARAYAGHTGSPLDWPAKTLKAGDHGVPGGENMVVLDNGEVRYLTVRESARLQAFPDEFHFHGTWTETMRQLGNAVPVRLAFVVARSVHDALLKARAPRK